jgi:hypothetical protein
MAERGRRSSASLSVVAGSIDGRPGAPSDLTDEQRAIWERVAANEAADTFKTAALQQLLKEFCRHCASALKLARMIEAMESLEQMAPDDLEDYDRLLKMRDRETKAIADKATKLRLTNQARYTPQAAATAAKKATSEMKPWQVAS